MTKIYIVTPNYNGLHFLKNYFKSLLNQTYTNFKIIFIDNSEDNSSIEFITGNYKDELKKEKIIIIKNPENYGFARSNNIGIKIALSDKKCKYILCLNNDTRVIPEFLEKIIQCAKDHSDAGSIQAKMIWGQYPKLIDSVGLEYSKNGLGFNRGAYNSSKRYNKEEEIFGCCAGACLYKREAIEDIEIDGEYFDEDFFAYREDDDLSLRLRWAGWKAWYSPKALVYHHKGGTKGIVSDFNVYNTGRNHVWVLFKNMPRTFLLKNFPLLILSELLQIGINLIRRKPVIIKAKIDAYKDIKKFLKKNKKIKKRIEFKDMEKWFILKWKVKIPKDVKLN